MSCNCYKCQWINNSQFKQFNYYCSSKFNCSFRRFSQWQCWKFKCIIFWWKWTILSGLLDNNIQYQCNYIRCKWFFFPNNCNKFIYSFRRYYILFLCQICFYSYNYWKRSFFYYLFMVFSWFMDSPCSQFNPAYYQQCNKIWK